MCTQTHRQTDRQTATQTDRHSTLFLYITKCSSFMWIEPLCFELSCTQTQTHRLTHRHTDGHEYSIVAIDKPQL